MEDNNNNNNNNNNYDGGCDSNNGFHIMLSYWLMHDGDGSDFFLYT